MSTVLLEAIGEKITQGSALDREDALALWESKDPVGIGMLADQARRRLHGDATTYLRVAEVSVGDADQCAIPATAGEVRLLGSAAELSRNIEALTALVARAGNVPVTVGALEDFENFAGTTSDLTRLAQRLRAAGAYAVASAAVDRLEAAETATRAVLDGGLSVSRFVVAHSNPAGPWPLLERVRAIQRATGAVRVFAPLPREQDPMRPSTGYWDVKMIALSRLVLDDIRSIQVDWTLHGPKLAQVGLLFGADDIDGVSTADETGTGKRRAPLEEIVRNIRAASLSPFERDGRFVIEPPPA